MSRLKKVVMLSFFILVVWVGWNAYSYFFSYSIPSLIINGIEADKYYSDKIDLIFEGYDDYKVNNLSVFLDNKPILKNHKINRSKFTCPITLNINEIKNGKHTISAELDNSSFRESRTTKQICFNVDNLPLEAKILTSSNQKVPQGKTLYLKFQLNKEINEIDKAVASVFNKEFNLVASKEPLLYDCFIPVDCEEQSSEQQIAIKITDKVGNTCNIYTKFQIINCLFKKQYIKIDQNKIKAENEIGLTERQLEQELEELAKKSPNKKLWQGIFYAPVEIKDQKLITTEYGAIRTSQERGLYQHKAIDISGIPKGVVWAPQDGIIVLKNRYAHSGNTVVIDHGCGILSLFFHLDSFANLEVGDKIKKGNPLGTIGKTGYATGYHLHWEMRINNTHVDPLQWTKQDFV